MAYSDEALVTQLDGDAESWEKTRRLGVYYGDPQPVAAHDGATALTQLDCHLHLVQPHHSEAEHRLMFKINISDRQPSRGIPRLRQIAVRLPGLTAPRHRDRAP